MSSIESNQLLYITSYPSLGLTELLLVRLQLLTTTTTNLSHHHQSADPHGRRNQNPEIKWQSPYKFKRCIRVTKQGVQHHLQLSDQ